MEVIAIQILPVQLEVLNLDLRTRKSDLSIAEAVEWFEDGQRGCVVSLKENVLFHCPKIEFY